MVAKCLADTVQKAVTEREPGVPCCVENEYDGRGLHPSTFQLNLSNL